MGVRLNQFTTDSFFSPASDNGNRQDDIEFLRFSFVILAQKRQSPEFDLDTRQDWSVYQENLLTTADIVGYSC
jgi:hypothetical protein